MSDDQFWANTLVDEIVKAKKKMYVCEGMWTPSGFFHIGNARPEIFTPFAVFASLKERGFSARQNFIIDDFDAVRKIPAGLPVSEADAEKFIGFPCATAPSPVQGYKSWADFFVSDVKEHIGEFGVDLNIISVYKSYKEGQFNDLIKFSLDHSREIVLVWNRVSGASKPLDFIPVQVVCEQCKKLYFTVATAWDQKFVHYKCEKCGFVGKVLPQDGAVKLHWRVHWVSNWIVNDVSFESGGKDHFSKGGSVEVGRALMAEVFKMPLIFQVPTEFIQLKGEKMSGSVGNVINLGAWLEIASPELFRFLNLSTRPNKVIEISLDDNNFLLLDERFNRAQRIFYGIEKAENEKIGHQIKHAFALSAIGPLPKKMPVQVSFSFASLLSQLFDPKKEMKKIEQVLLESGHIKEALSSGDKKLLELRLVRVRNWIQKYAPQEFKIGFLESFDKSIVQNISPQLVGVFPLVKTAIEKASSADEVQEKVFEVSKAQNLVAKELFSALYLVLLGKSSGPKFGSLVFVLGKERVIKRLSEVV